MDILSKINVKIDKYDIDKKYKLSLKSFLSRNLKNGYAMHANAFDLWVRSLSVTDETLKRQLLVFYDSVTKNL